MPQQPFLAMITPLGGEVPGPPVYPSHPIYYPPSIWGPTDPRPTPPIYMPGQPPLEFWGPNDPRPTPPIYMPPGTAPQPPLGIWGPNDPRPTPPIHMPGPPYQPPLGTWGPNDPRPTPPIYLPPQSPITDPVDPNKGYLVAYVPKSDLSGYERVTFTVELPVDHGPPPTEPEPKQPA